MKMILMVLTALCLTMFSAPKGEAQVLKQSFIKSVYFGVTSCAAGNKGLSYAAPKCFGDVDVWAIPAGTIITKVYVIIDTLMTGTTDVDIGDDDDPNGFVDGSLSVTVGTAGMYGWNVKTAGAYLRTETAGATDAADIYVVPNAKHYSASGKEVKMDLTTAATAGKMRVIIEGYYAGVP